MSNLPMKPIVESTTTKAVFLGTGGTLSVLAIIIGILRSAGLGLPWDADQDNVVIGILTTLLGPLLSRIFSKILKKKRGAKKAG